MGFYKKSVTRVKCYMYMLCEINFNMHYFDFQVLQMQEGRGQDLDRNQGVDHVQDQDHPRVQEVQEVVVRQVNQAEEAVLGPEVQAALVQIDRKESCFFVFCKFQLLYFCTFFGIIKPLRRFIQRKRNIVINLHT